MMVLEVVRAACEKVAPIRKNEAFDLFFERGFRKPTEAIQDFINRREREYEQLKSLSPKTNVTSDLLTYFLLRLSGIDKTQQRLISHLGAVRQRVRLGKGDERHAGAA